MAIYVPWLNFDLLNAGTELLAQQPNDQWYPTKYIYNYVSYIEGYIYLLYKLLWIGVLGKLISDLIYIYIYCII